MRITLYRADIEEAVRQYISAGVDFYNSHEMVITFGDELIVQVTIGEGPSDPIHVVQQDVKPAAMAGLSSLSTAQIPALFGQNQALAKAVEVPMIAETIAIEECVVQRAVQAAADVAQVTMAEELPAETNDNTAGADPVPVVEAEPVAEPVRKVQSLFKNLKKPVNG